MYIYIRAMSEPQAEVYRKISDQTGNIVEHIIKLVEYPDAQERNHWKQEIFSFLHRVSKLRNTKKLPSTKLIMKALTIYNDMVPELKNGVHRTYKNYTPRNLDDDKILSILLSYENWHANELSLHGLVIDEDVYDKLDELTK